MLAFEEYLSRLGPVGVHVSPLDATEESTAIKFAADGLHYLPSVDRSSLAQWVAENPTEVYVLGLTVGLSRERLKNTLRHRFETSSWARIAVQHPYELVDYLDEEFALLHALEEQRHRHYDFGDLLVARASSRSSARRAGVSGRRVEDEIESTARGLGLECTARCRFAGRNRRTAPCDLAIPSDSSPQIVVAAKGFDSTGSKLTDAVREIEEMADVRLPRQTVYAVIDGIGWKSRQADLRRIHQLWETQQIDGMYTLSTLDVFRKDLTEAARLRGLLP